MDYLDFNLKIGPRIAENQYAVAAHSASMGEASAIFTQPLSDEQLELFILRVGLARRGVRRIHSPEWQAAQEFGQKLFRALFTNEIGASYLSSHNEAVRQGKGLRVKLTLEAPELANYPWEFLYDPSNSQFLSLFEDTPVLRYIELPRPILPLTVTPPLRILAVTSSPKDFDALDIGRERRNLSQALDGLAKAGLVELTWLATATLEELREQLLKSSYHVFHFIGHGGFDRANQDGVLVFEDAAGLSNRVSGERLAILLGNHRTLRLAILNACEGARTSQQDPFAGTAMTLLRTGNLPAVVAMQFEITDSAAIDFAKGFYGAIATGRPVDAAVGQGRQAIFMQNNDIEWSTPVLYLRAVDGVIFQVDPSRAVAEAERIEQAQAEAERVEDKSAEPTRGGQAPAVAEEPGKESEGEVRRTAVSAPAMIQSLPALFGLSVGVWTVSFAIPSVLGISSDNLSAVLISFIFGTIGMWLLLRSSRFSLTQATGIGIVLGYAAAFVAVFVINIVTSNPVQFIVGELMSPLFNSQPDELIVVLQRVVTAAMYGALYGLLGGGIMWWQLRRAERA